MPHTSRRKRQPTRIKRQVTELEDGWQRIERSVPGSDRHGDMRESDTVPGVDPELSIEKLKQEYGRMRERWLGTTCRARMVDILKFRAGDEGLGVDTAVCLAMGSVTRNWSLRIHSFWQLVFFLDVVELLQSMHEGGDKIKLYAQEPRFTDMDREFLESLGFTMLESPQAEAYVGKGCFLYVPHLEWHTEIPYLQKAREAPLYITSSLGWIIEEAERLIKNSLPEYVTIVAFTSVVTNVTRRLEPPKEDHFRNGPTNPPVVRDELAFLRPEDAISAARALLQTHHETKVPDCELTDTLQCTIYIKKDETDEVTDGIKALQLP